MARLLGEVFSRSEPPAIAAGMSAADLEELVGLFGAKAVVEGLTIIARAGSGDLVGAMLTEDFGTPRPSGIGGGPTRFAPVGALLDGLDAEYRATHAIVPGSHLHLFMVGVSEAFSGAGIAGNMIIRCLANGARRGYRVAVTEATGPASQHVFRKLGFQDVYSRTYRDFLYQGRRVFETIEEQGGAILMERAVGGRF